MDDYLSGNYEVAWDKFTEQFNETADPYLIHYLADIADRDLDGRGHTKKEAATLYLFAAECGDGDIISYLHSICDDEDNGEERFTFLCNGDIDREERAQILVELWWKKNNSTMSSEGYQKPLPGMIVISEFITRHDEERLLNAIDTQGTWDASEIRRRTQHYGYRYHYTGAKRGELTKADEFPAWSEFLLDRIHERLDLEKGGLPRFEQMIVNEYTAGQGISKHTDHTKAFGNIIGQA